MKHIILTTLAAMAIFCSGCQPNKAEVSSQSNPLLGVWDRDSLAIMTSDSVVFRTLTQHNAYLKVFYNDTTCLLANKAQNNYRLIRYHFDKTAELFIENGDIIPYNLINEDELESWWNTPQGNITYEHWTRVATLMQTHSPRRDTSSKATTTSSETAPEGHSSTN